MHPPGGVRTTMEAICVMLYGLKNPKWDEIRKSIRRDDFIPSIVGFNTQVNFRWRIHDECSSSSGHDPQNVGRTSNQTVLVFRQYKS
jgi:hypothetical protein